MLPARLPDRPFVLSCVAGFFAAFAFALTTVPALPLLALAKGTPLPILGLIVAAPLLVAAVATQARWPLDPTTRRRVALAGAGASVLFSLAYAFALADWQLLLLRFGHGLALVAVPLGATPTAVDAIEESGRGRLLAAPAVAGWALGPLAGGFSAEIAGPAAPFFLAAAFGMVALAALAFLPATRLADGAADWSDPRQHAIAGPAALRLAVGCVEAFLPVYVLDLGLGARQAGMLFAIWMAWAAVSGPLLSGLISRSPGGTLVLGLMLAALGTAALGVTAGFYGAVAAMACLGLATAAVYAAVKPQVAFDGGHPAGGTARFAATRIAHGVGPIAAGLSLPVMGAAGTFILAGIALALAALLTAALLPASALAGRTHPRHP